jgi:hypothetical protein
MYVAVFEKQSSFKDVNGLYGIALRQLSLQDGSESSSEEDDEDDDEEGGEEEDGAQKEQS